MEQKFDAFTKLFTIKAITLHKMRFFTLVVCVIFFFSCKSPVDKELLTGSWTLENVVNKSGSKMHDKITFQRNASVTIEIFINDSLYHNYKGKYRFESNASVLITRFDTFPETKFEVVKLTGKHLELRREETKQIDSYKRF